MNNYNYAALFNYNFAALFFAYCCVTVNFKVTFIITNTVTEITEIRRPVQIEYFKILFQI